MIVEQKVYRCTKCGSTNIVRNGHNSSGNPIYICKDCKASRVLEPKIRYTEEQKEMILKAYKERASMRAIERIFGVSRKTLSSWIKKKSKAYRN